MCRYANFRGDSRYRSHYVCFGCRKSVKLQKEHPKPVCPECGQALKDLGYDFKVPRREDDNQWRKAELLVQHALGFDSCGCKGPGYRPKTLAEAKSLIATIERLVSGEKYPIYPLSRLGIWVTPKFAQRWQLKR